MGILTAETAPKGAPASDDKLTFVASAIRSVVPFALTVTSKFTPTVCAAGKVTNVHVDWSISIGVRVVINVGDVRLRCTPLAGRPSPVVPDWPLPATVSIIPVVLLICRTRWLFRSPNHRLPPGSTINPSGLFINADRDGKPSRQQPAVPLASPAIRNA